MKYHNSPNGPRPCRATVQECPYGAQGLPHFNTQAEAQAAYEGQMAQSFGNFDTLKRTNSEKSRQKAYETVDKSLELMRKAAASKPAQKTVAAMNAVRTSPQRAKALLGNLKTKFGSSVRSFKDSGNSIMNQAKQSSVALSQNVSEKAKEQYGLMKSINETNFGAIKEATTNTKNNVTSKAKSLTQSIGDKKIVRTRNVESLRLGERLEDGSRITSIASYDGNVYINTLTDDGRFGTMKMSTSDTVKTYSTVRSRLAKIKDSSMYRRISAATELQRQSFKTLIGATGKRDEAAMLVDIQSAAHAKRKDYALGS